MKKSEKAHLAKLASLSCIVCRNMGYNDSPAEIHHLRAGAGIGQRSNHFLALPICHVHHRTGGYGIAIHAGQKEWESRYGTETELLEQVNRLVRYI